MHLLVIEQYLDSIMHGATIETRIFIHTASRIHAHDIHVHVAYEQARLIYISYDKNSVKGRSYVM